MAMLAEPKRKQKFSFDPRNTNWSNDDTKFGHKLMEKMGWSKGKGLGAKEDGKTENISVSVKNDTRGVGCSKSHVDNWIAHQDDFNALLANLGQDHSTGDNKPDTDKKVLSLEQTSRTSKGRLHYQKFTKGKDLSLKSETDLDCVFGKRKALSGTSTPQSQSGTNTPQTQSEPSSDSEENSHGFNTVTSTDSVQDYFKKKMAERLNRLKGNTNDVVTKLEDSSDSKDRIEADLADGTAEVDRDSNEMQTKSKKKSKKRKLDSNENNDQDTEMVIGETKDDVNDKEIVKKKKKSKQKKSDDVESEIENNNETEIVDNIQNETIDGEKTSKKKSKKKKRNSKIMESTEMESEDVKESVVDSFEQSGENKECADNKESISEDKPKKKKKNKKRKRESTEHEDIKPKKKVTFMIGGDENEDTNEDNVKEERTEKNAVKKETVNESVSEKGLTNVTNKYISYRLRNIATRSDETKAKQPTVNVCENVRNKSCKEVKQQIKSTLNETAIDKKDSILSVVKTASYNKSSGLKGVMDVHEVKQVSEAFSGSNVNHVKGYSGMRVTSEDVRMKLDKQRLK